MYAYSCVCSVRRTVSNTNCPSAHRCQYLHTRVRRCNNDILLMWFKLWHAQTCIFLYVHTCAFAHMHLYIHFMYIYFHVHVHRCTYMYMYTDVVYKYTDVHVHVHLCTCTCICKNIIPYAWKLLLHASTFNTVIFLHVKRFTINKDVSDTFQLRQVARVGHIKDTCQPHKRHLPAT